MAYAAAFSSSFFFFKSCTLSLISLNSFSCSFCLLAAFAFSVLSAYLLSLSSLWFSGNLFVVGISWKGSMLMFAEGPLSFVINLLISVKAKTMLSVLLVIYIEYSLQFQWTIDWDLTSLLIFLRYFTTISTSFVIEMFFIDFGPNQVDSFLKIMYISQDKKKCIYWYQLKGPSMDKIVILSSKYGSTIRVVWLRLLKICAKVLLPNFRTSVLVFFQCCYS